MPTVRTSSGTTPFGTTPPSSDTRPGHEIRESAVNSAGAGRAAVTEADRVMFDVVGRMDETAARGPSRLPGWTRAHVITHLARGADALVNLLLWARTGIEHPAYESRADRDADIARGAERPLWLLNEDLRAATERFAAAMRDLPERAWAAEVSTATGFDMRAATVPWLRLREIWMHLVDLDTGVRLQDVPQPHLEALLDDVTTYFVIHRDMSPTRLEVTLPDGGQLVFELGSVNETLVSTTVRGPAVPVLEWLTGRGDGTGLKGTLPVLPAWL